MDRVFRLVSKVKICFTQAGNYIGMVNFLILLLSLRKLYEIDISIFILIPVGFSLMLLVGFLDYTFILPNYLKHINKQNDIKEDLEEIKKILKNVK